MLFFFYFDSTGAYLGKKHNSSTENVALHLKSVKHWILKCLIIYQHSVVKCIHVCVRINRKRGRRQERGALTNSLHLSLFKNVTSFLLVWAVPVKFPKHWKMRRYKSTNGLLWPLLVLPLSSLVVCVPWKPGEWKYHPRRKGRGIHNSVTSLLSTSIRQWVSWMARFCE